MIGATRYSATWLFFFSCLVATGFSKPHDYQVELVQVIFRHGDRTATPYEWYPNDPYNETIYEPFGRGQLTSRGKARAYNLGQVLKKKYEKLLGEDYSPNVLFAYSTNVDRTKMSLQLVLAGMYPPKGPFHWSDTVEWMPIPVYHNFDSFDFLWTAYYCPKFEIIWNNTLALPSVQKQLKEYSSFIKYLSKTTGLPDDPHMGARLFEIMHSQKNLGYEYPSWCNDEVYEKLKEISAFRYDVYSYTDQMKRIAVGPTIRRFLRNIKTNDGQPSPKIYLYGGHDDNVATLMRTHKFTSPNPARSPDYSSAFIMEKLRGRDLQTYIRLLYYPGEGDEFQVMQLKNCNKECPLSRYLKIMRPVLPFGEGTQCLYEEAYQDVKNVIDGYGPGTRSNILELKYAYQIGH
ncbi:venom acid phosphatase Acph-1-like [Copidosoma floridanum]|uniref:venom acid phosphatase Acph-1-like n=1 Tax=Copidosoma floridanum TaxID=29053 RepID=UPI0006C97474|nr:venom acid phosphatase Acph-1-like [Copidosoma floridanum]